MKVKTIMLWVLQMLVATILFWTAWSKLSSQPNSIHIFTQLGMEPEGRFIIGVIEFTAAVALLSKRLAAGGALLALGTMIGAMIAHISILGFDVPHMILWSTVFVCALIITIIRRRQIPFIGSSFEEERLPYA